MLNEEVKRYRELSGDNNPHTPISRIGGYLDGYEKAMEQKTGHWEYKRTRIAGKELLAGAYCSECKEEYTVYHSEIFNYCPNCGAKMEVDK